MASSSLRACGYLLSHSLHTLTPTAHRLHLCLCNRRPPSPRPAPPRPGARNGWLFHMDLVWARQFGLITAISYKQGFAFVDYEDAADASDAIRSKNGQTMWGRRISVELSKDAKTLAEEGDKRFERGPLRRDDGPPPHRVGGRAQATKNLFVANIPEGITEPDVQDHFSQYGPVTMVKFLPQKGSAKSGFVDFATVDDATRAHEGENIVGGSKLRTDYNKRGPAGGAGGDRGGGDRGDYRRPHDDYDRRDFDRPPPPRYEDRRYDDYDRRDYDRRDRDIERERERDYDRRDYDRYDERRDYGRPDPYAREREHDRRNDRRPHDDYDRRDFDRPPPPRYEDRRYDDYDRRDMGRGPPPPARYEERRYDEPAPRRDYDEPLPRRDYDDYDRRDQGRPPPGLPPPRYDDRAPPRYEDRRYDDDRRREMDRPFEPPRHNAPDRREYGNGMREMNGDRGGEM